MLAARRVLLAQLALVGALAPTPRGASAATLVGQSRTISLDTNTVLVAYTCLTPGFEIGCPVVLEDVNDTVTSSAPDFSPFDDVVASAIGEVSQVSPISGQSVDVTAALDLAGHASLLCGPPGYPACVPAYVAIYRYEQGSGESVTEVDFVLDAETAVRLDGAVALDGDDYNGYAWLAGAIEIELGPLGGAPVLDELVQLTWPLAPLNVPIDHEIVLPAGTHRLRVVVSGAVISYFNINGFPAASSVTAEADLDLQFVPPAPVPAPAAAWPGRLLLGLALSFAAVRHGRAPGAARRARALAPFRTAAPPT